MWPYRPETSLCLLIPIQPIATMNPMDESPLLDEVFRALDGDVSKDPRYLKAFGTTRSEIIVPIVDRAGRKVMGTIDVESEKVDAFSEEDRAALERCAVALAELFG